LLKFHKGAFFNISPIQIYCIKYDHHYNISNAGLISDLKSVLFAFLFFKHNATVYKFDVFYPEYLNIDKSDPHSWHIYSRKVENIMSKCLNVPIVEVTLADKS